MKSCPLIGNHTFRNRKCGRMIMRRSKSGNLSLKLVKRVLNRLRETSKITFLRKIFNFDFEANFSDDKHFKFGKNNVSVKVIIFWYPKLLVFFSRQHMHAHLLHISQNFCGFIISTSIIPTLEIWQTSPLLQLPRAIQIRSQNVEHSH